MEPPDERMANFMAGNAHYQILDVIGEGAYGIVWCAQSIEEDVVHTDLELQLCNTYCFPTQGCYKAYNSL
jgi:hypothetical protein